MQWQSFWRRESATMIMVVTMGDMIILFSMGIGLMWYGNRVRTRSLYPNGRTDGLRWPLRQILTSLPKWEQERVLMLVGGVFLQGSGLIVMLGALPF